VEPLELLAQAKVITAEIALHRLELEPQVVVEVLTTMGEPQQAPYLVMAAQDRQGHHLLQGLVWEGYLPVAEVVDACQPELQVAAALVVVVQVVMVLLEPQGQLIQGVAAEVAALNHLELETAAPAAPALSS